MDEGDPPVIDPGLVRSAQRGDVLAADQLLACLEPIVRRACDAVDPSRGDDATQDTLLVVFRQLRDLRAPEAIVTWARTVAAREAMRGARADRRHGTPTDRELDGLMVTTLSPTGRRASLRAVIRDGWCAMEGTQVSIVMAAVPAGAETWFAHLESTRHPAAGAARPLLDLKIRAELRILDRVIRRELR